MRDLLEKLRKRFDPETLGAALAAKQNTVARLRPARKVSKDSVARFWDRIVAETDASEADRDLLLDADTLDNLDAYDANIENMIGTVKVPVGVIGPLRINGLHAQGDFLVPLATSEAALVASYGRGAEVTDRKSVV